jgi:hypothetical protein
MKNVLAMLGLLSSLLRGCCSEMPRTEPPYPSDVAGWKQNRERGLRVLGNFVLKKDQSTDNGVLRIKVLDIIPGEPCSEAGTYQHQARVTIQFIRVSDQKVLCEDTFVEKGSMTMSVGPCRVNLSEFGILGIYIRAINLKEGWAFFELRG